MPMFKQLMMDESGATAVEYGLIVALITLAVVGAMGTLGQSVSDMWAGGASEIDRVLGDG